MTTLTSGEGAVVAAAPAAVAANSNQPDLFGSAA